MDAYATRIIDTALDELQPVLKAIILEGPKAVGKTATAARRAKTVLRLDLESQQALLAADPSILTSLPGPVLIDEWQRMPASWDYVRRAVDDGSPRGRFLITGSAVPKNAAVHSGAGRIVPFRMRPLSLAERGLGESPIHLRDLLEGSFDVEGTTTLGAADYVREIVSSGFPAIHSEPARARRVELAAYLENIVTREFPQQGYAMRKPEALRAWLTAYAAATGTTASYTAILDAATAGESDKPAKETVGSYREALSSLWLLDPLPAWTPSHNVMARLGQAPKHYLADPGLATQLLGLDERNLLTDDPRTIRGDPLLGALFENLVVMSIRVYAEACDARALHLRTRNGDHEIDVIVQRPDGKVLGIEVKLTATPKAADVRHLLWLRETLGTDFLGGIVITTGQHAYRRSDGIIVVPAALLGP